MTRDIVIRYAGPPPPSGIPTATQPMPGWALKSYNPDTDGTIDATWTAYLPAAMHFESQLAAFECWRAVSKTHPVRDGEYGDGRPNRPLTAWTIAIETATEVAS
jgi:hypothetical protein